MNGYVSWLDISFLDSRAKLYGLTALVAPRESSLKEAGDDGRLAGQDSWWIPQCCQIANVRQI